MLGALIGDIAGSRFRQQQQQFTWDNELLSSLRGCKTTTVSDISLAAADSILKSKGDHTTLKDHLSGNLTQIETKNSPQNAICEEKNPQTALYRNAVLCAGVCGFAADTLEEAIDFADIATSTIDLNHVNNKFAESVSAAVFLAKTGNSLLDIRDYIETNYDRIDFTLDNVRQNYDADISFDGTSIAFEAFFESTNFEDAIRNAISINSSDDTIVSVTGSLAEAYYGIPTDLRKHALTFLDNEQLTILNNFESEYGLIVEKELAKGSKRTVSFFPEQQTSSDNRLVSITNAIDIAEKAQASIDISSRETTANQLYNHLYEACNILRGPIDQDDYKSYVIPILFFKRISDVYDEETADNERQYGEDIDLYPEEELHDFVIPDGCHWIDVRQTSEDVGKAIVDAMMGIERANPDTLAGLFSSFDDANWTDKNKLSDERLKNLIEHMSALPVGNKNYSADVMGDAYEYLIKKFADLSKKNAGEFYTPRSVVKLMVRLLQPKSGESVYDPAAGTGGMLIEAIRNMDNEKASYGKIYGQEKNLSTSAIARMNLFLHGAREFKIVREDTLRKPVFIHNGQLQQFDCVLANPPFGLDKWGADIFENDQWGRNIWGSPTDSSADFAWLQHMYKSMRPKTGRCAVVMPQGVLFHSGREGKIRQKMIETDSIECVIALVGNLFYGAGVSACILFMNNNKPRDHREKICLIDATNIYTAQRAKNIMTDADTDQVYSLWHNYENVVDKCAIVDLKTIADKGYTLAVNSYIEKSPEPPIDPKKVRRDFMAALQEVQESEAELLRLLKEGGYIND